ncbi:hypothetical protein INT45_000077 [Circinella minor]|uniref:DH domain-containing protein n=1 Tax=Circinella minor TaxID=1195481 RepID=A0A8H7SB36_9FUNG|nr:hypothetical protein INT45_000077 [Circinella minor]
MYSPPPYWSYSAGPSRNSIDNSYTFNNKSRARSTGRLNSTSSSNSGSTTNSYNSNINFINNIPTSPILSESFCSSTTDGINSTTLCQELSEDQFDIIDSLDYEDVDDIGLIDRELSHRNRESLVQQLYNAEQDYLEYLNRLIILFMEPLRKDAQQPSSNFIGIKKVTCTEHEIQRLFGNIEEIYDTQREILQSLELRLRIWGPTQIISDIFQGWFKMLFDIYTPYLNNYDNAVTTYERLRNYQLFRKFTDTLHKEPSLKGATLYSLLQLPVRSIYRLSQRIGELSDSTPPLHPDYVGLKMCKQRVLRLVEEIKSKVDDAENVDRVLDLHRRISGIPLTIRKGRRLILETELSRTYSKISETRVYFLFSDFIIFVRPRRQQQNETENVQFQYRGHLNLEQAQIKLMAPQEVSGKENCVGITPYFHGVELVDTVAMMQNPPITHVMQLNSAQEQEEWLENLTIVVNKLNSLASKRQNVHSVSNNSNRRSNSSRRRKEANTIQWALLPNAY